jgi:hypothetical protein
MTLFCNFTRQEGPPETAPDARRAKDNGKSKYGAKNQSNMKTKKIRNINFIPLHTLRRRLRQ